ncbi:hypothetical protein EXY72_05765 [Burkholderia pseudomallei]|nr:hypothetical protein EXY72_05765 [Burkholderia pseudomallei]QBL77390.1 hypothetical protein EYA82_05790 [Burkholderia pseudomallei]
MSTAECRGPRGALPARASNVRHAARAFASHSRGFGAAATSCDRPRVANRSRTRRPSASRPKRLERPRRLAQLATCAGVHCDRCRSRGRHRSRG